MKKIVLSILVIMCTISFVLVGTNNDVHAAENGWKLLLQRAKTNVERNDEEYSLPYKLSEYTFVDDLKKVLNTSFVVVTAKENIKVDFSVLNNCGVIYLPGGEDVNELSLSWGSNVVLVDADGQTYHSGEAMIAKEDECIKYLIVKDKACAWISFKTLVGSEEVEAMYLEIDESLGYIEDMKDDKEVSCYGILDFNDQEEYFSIKGRGNVSWKRVKKPYNITIYKNSSYEKKKEVSLIDGVSAKKWSLLANYDDPTFLRYKIALDLANKLGIGLPSRFVDLYMNGEYQGLYLLTPKNDYLASDDGFILENDNYESDDYQFAFPNVNEWILPGQLNRMSIKNVGKNVSEAGITNEEIAKYFLEAWDVLCDSDSDDYLKYFDLDSWVKMYMMFEVSKVYDADSGSIFMHRDGLEDTDLLIAGPIWDYDKCFGWIFLKTGEGMGIDNQITAQGWYIDSLGELYGDNALYFLKEFGKHDSFKKRFVEMYKEYKWAFDELVSEVNKQNELIAASADMDDNLYGSLHSNYFAVAINLKLGTGKYQLNYKITATRQAEVDNMNEFINKRIMWLDDQMYPEKKVLDNTASKKEMIREVLEDTEKIVLDKIIKMFNSQDDKVMLKNDQVEGMGKCILLENKSKFKTYFSK